MRPSTTRKESKEYFRKIHMICGLQIEVSVLSNDLFVFCLKDGLKYIGDISTCQKTRKLIKLYAKR